MSTNSTQLRNIESQQLLDRLARIEAILATLVDQKIVKEWYTPSEIADILSRAEWTVREWCRLGRVHAEKRPCGRGSSLEWIISHAELDRIRNEGLLPDPRVIRRR